jgi:hypothetical protein
MPLRTREAMLDGIGTTDIIVGGYSDGQGGICPMLAAHRNGGRTAFAAFAHAWDRYTGADGQARRATDRELGTLRSMLEASIEAEEVVGQGVLGEAVSQHRHAQQARARREEFEVEPLDALPPVRTNRPVAGTGSPARDTPVMSPAGT